MTELVAPRAGSRILEIGTGSGYQTAILAILGAAIVSIERQPELAVTARERLGPARARRRGGHSGRRRQRRRSGRRAVGRDRRDGRGAVDPDGPPRAALARTAAAW